MLLSQPAPVQPLKPFTIHELTLFKQGESIAFLQGLMIRLIQPDDLIDIFTMLADERVNQSLFFAPAADEVLQQFFDPIIENTQQAISVGEWPEHPTAVIFDSEGRYMGMAGINRVMFLQGNYEVGYQLPVHSWGKGIATQACRLMTQICFEQLGAHKVSADCYAGNIGSYRTLEKCGFIQEGRQQNYYKVSPGSAESQRFDDKLYYGLTLGQYRDLTEVDNSPGC